MIECTALATANLINRPINYRTRSLQGIAGLSMTDIWIEQGVQFEVKMLLHKPFQARHLSNIASWFRHQSIPHFELIELA